MTQAEVISIEIPGDFNKDSPPDSYAVARILQRIAFALTICIILFAAYIAGMSLRQWTWDACRPLRWQTDRDNAFYWGMRVNQDERKTIDANPVGTWQEFRAGYRTIYDTEWNRPSSHAIDQLDYTPLRLLTAALWSRWLVIHRPLANSPLWSEVWPLLSMNIICTIAAAFGAFFLVRFWIIRQGRSRTRARLYGGIALLLIWFNPAGIIDSHGWPQWDMWSAPFLIWAAFSASTGSWFFAGVFLVTGAMLKGQILLIAPAFVIWALLSGWFAPTLRLVIGVLSTTAILTAIWLMQSDTAWRWFSTVLLTGALSYAALQIWQRSRLTTAILIACTLILFWPLHNAQLRHTDSVILLLITWIICTFPLLQLRWPSLRQWSPIWVATLLSVGLWFSAYFFDGSMAWFRVGFVFPTNHFQVMSYAASSLPQILEARWGWNLHDIMITTPFPKLGFDDGITLQWTMRIFYGAFLLLCGIAAAIQTKRRNPRALLALIAPSVLFYAVLAQMQERYLLWGAIFSACGIAVSLDMMMLHFLVTLIAFADILRKLCWIHPTYAPTTYTVVGPVQSMPDLGWVTLMLGLIYVYQACKLDKRKSPPPYVSELNNAHSPATPGSEVLRRPGFPFQEFQTPLF